MNTDEHDEGLDLNWGETPFHHMTHNQLMRHAQRLYAAVESANNALHNLRPIQYEHSPYWMPNGAGGRAMEQTEQALTRARGPYNPESVYRMFFRYARDLLFKQDKVRIGFDWAWCDKCGDAVGGPPLREVTGVVHHTVSGITECDGVMKPLTWNYFPNRGLRKPDGYAMPKLRCHTENDHERPNAAGSRVKIPYYTDPEVTGYDDE